MSFSLSPFTLNFLSPPCHCLAKTHFTISFSQQTIQFDPPKKKRKPKPSFADQIRDKWSIKNPPLTKTLPWQNPDYKNQIKNDPVGKKEEFEEKVNGSLELGVIESKSASFVYPNRVNLPPWVHGNMAKETHLSEFSSDNENKEREKEKEKDGSLEFGVTESFRRNSVSFVTPNSVNLPPWVHGNMAKETHLSEFSSDNEDKEKEGNGSLEIGVTESFRRKSVSFVTPNSVNLPPLVLGNTVKETHLSEFSLDSENKGKEDNVSLEFGVTESFRRKSDSFVAPLRISGNMPKEMQLSEINIESEDDFDGEYDRFENSRVKSEDMSEKVRVPWERVNNGQTVVAERLIPETELKRLRNVAKRMVERIKVGSAGVNQELVDSIRARWKEDEVVKMKFEGPPTFDMKRTHEVLENKTSGIVIWRSGSSIALYRGMTYNLPCVQSYTNDNLTTNTHSFSTTKDSSFSSFTRYKDDLSNEEITDMSELDNLLQELGPRFKDWSGPEPIPVDADLLPSVVPGGKRPFRLLPNGIRQGLRDKETTFYRQSARRMPPHFALGRNRELQGLAVAMIKLWEKSAIAKIAIKRGVQNTNNERMAEELKNLTGGTLLSRNKEFIVFYRGNDFLPPAVSQTLDEAQNEAVLKADEEEAARNQLSTMTFSTKKAARIIPKVAGTLGETIAATLRWGNQPSSEDRERMRMDMALARHASMVKFLENKLALANGKIKIAEKALAKVQESLSPADLPTDLETITDEERFLFRKIGLSMKPYLPLGRRGMFDGTIQNIHLHWKYREVVKLIVERKSFAQVKQIAIGLEAESGGVLVCVDKTMKGYVIILYRGKNYQRPDLIRPKNLLTKRQAWAKSIELQRREGLKHHISDLTEKIEKLKAELENMPTVEEIDDETFYSRMDDPSSDEETEEEGGEEMLLNDTGNEIDII